MCIRDSWLPNIRNHVLKQLSVSFRTNPVRKRLIEMEIKRRDRNWFFISKILFFSTYIIKYLYLVFTYVIFKQNLYHFGDIFMYLTKKDLLALIFVLLFLALGSLPVQAATYCFWKKFFYNFLFNKFPATNSEASTTPTFEKSVTSL